MLKKIGLVFISIVAIFLVYASFQPNEMTIAREITVNATPEVIFPFINNSEKADAWMPWHESDPAMKIAYSGPTEGVGSKSNWTSTGDMGTGEALVVESIPNQTVKTQLTYTKPMEMSQLAEITLTAKDNGQTLVRWSVSGKNNFISKIFGVLMNVEKMVGTEFEKGLLKLKMSVETQK